MFSKNWLRIASGVGLLIACVSVVGQSMLRSEWGNQLYYGTTIIAVFWLFVPHQSPRKKKSAIRPWLLVEKRVDSQQLKVERDLGHKGTHAPGCRPPIAALRKQNITSELTMPALLPAMNRLSNSSGFSDSIWLYADCLGR